MKKLIGDAVIKFLLTLLVLGLIGLALIIAAVTGFVAIF